jgi:hypothetical protein
MSARRAELRSIGREGILRLVHADGVLATQVGSVPKPMVGVTGRYSNLRRVADDS